MKQRHAHPALGILAICLLASFVVFAATPEFREYHGAEYQLGMIPLPADWDEPAEWTFARLMYPENTCPKRFPIRGYWTDGGTSWTIDYPRGDRHISSMVRRLTSVDARTVEQPVNLDFGDEVFYWPWLYVVEPGAWDLSDDQAEKLREYLLRGGFLMADDFHGSNEWSCFLESMRRVFPDRPIVDIADDDPILHTIWDVDPDEQIPGAQYTQTGVTWEVDGYDPEWKAILDDAGRIMVAICHNMDLGDAVEHADDPRYPQPWSAQAMRIFGNYIVYAMTH
jgi:hypothetical protein